ncbi:MAG TPA: hypothetical protein VGM76_05640 [Lacipirellulaceae bacterium]|jgi:hypothetical protein
MTEFMSRLSSGDAIALVAISGGMLVGILSIAAGIWHKVRSEEIAANLKRDMLDRGMSADEIKTVLEAGRPNPEPTIKWRWRC